MFSCSYIAYVMVSQLVAHQAQLHLRQPSDDCVVLHHKTVHACLGCDQRPSHAKAARFSRAFSLLQCTHFWRLQRMLKLVPLMLHTHFPVICGSGMQNRLHIACTKREPGEDLLQVAKLTGLVKCDHGTHASGNSCDAISWMQSVSMQ